MSSGNYIFIYRPNSTHAQYLLPTHLDFATGPKQQFSSPLDTQAKFIYATKLIVQNLKSVINDKKYVSTNCTSSFYKQKQTKHTHYNWQRYWILWLCTAESHFCLPFIYKKKRKKRIRGGRGGGGVEHVWNVMCRNQRNGRVHLNRGWGGGGVSSVDYWQPRCAHQR